MAFDAEASAVAADVFDELLAWYSDDARARAARVFAFVFAKGAGAEEPRFEALAQCFARWLGTALPDLEGYALESYVADALYIASEHAADPARAPQLWELETERGSLFLLRTQEDLAQTSDDCRLSSRNSPDTEAAMGGIFRIDGCSQAYSDHAVGCARCLAMLQRWDERGDGLTADWQHLRRWTVPVRPARPVPLPPLPPVSGVALVIPRPPWWRFWG